MAEGRDDPDDLRDRQTAYLFAQTPRPEGPPIPETDLASGAREDPDSPTPGGAPSSGQTPVMSGTGGTLESIGRLEPGQVIFEKFEVIKLLGQGGMGAVWLVRHRELGIERAVKVIVSGIAPDPGARARLRREARAMALFSHPNAVTVHDARMANDAAFIEMEYVRGRSISTLMEPGVPMPLDWTARVLVQLCDVLHVAHEHGIVHRDLKPSNLMLLDGQPPGREFLKVLDFGIAKILGPEAWDHDDVTTRTGMFMGTAPYASPDQAVSPTVDGRSDLYSVGVILYEFLTGSRPFAGPATLYHHVNTPPPTFAEKNPEVRVPAGVERVVMQCLAKKPEDRPQTARELAEEFLRALPPNLAAPSLPGTSADSPRWSSPVTDAGGATTEAFSQPSTDLPDTEADRTIEKYRRPRTPPRWVAGALLGLVLGATLVGLSHLWPSGDTAKIPPDPPIKVTPPAPPRPVYEAAPGAELVDGWPRVVVRASDAVRKTDGPRFLLIEGGSFVMGALDQDQADAGSVGGQPARAVTVKPFYLQEMEVTNGEMLRYFRTKGIARVYWPNDWKVAWEDLLKKYGLEEADAERHPAVGIPYEMAEDFARWSGGRLPTEAEWEYAARSRGKPKPYVWGDESDRRMARVDVIGFTGRDEPPTTPVGSFLDDTTEQGIRDLTGNVREWCVGAEWLPQPCICRGGSWATEFEQAKTTFRSDDETGLPTMRDRGFRIALDRPPPRPTDRGR